MSALQLQFWDAQKRVYIPASCCEKAGSVGARKLPDIGRAMACGRSWRVAKADRPLKPRYVAPRHGGCRTVAQVQSDYAEWARRTGLRQITAYKGKPLALGRYSGTIRYLTIEEHFAVECVTEAPRFGSLRQEQVAA